MLYEIIVYDDRDLPWINNEIKELMNVKNSVYKSYCRFNRDVFLFVKFSLSKNSSVLSNNLAKLTIKLLDSANFKIKRTQFPNLF